MLLAALGDRRMILLLDEPTNHLDVESIEWLEQFLKDWQGLTLLFITHDRAFVDKLATRIIELDRGKLSSYDVTQGAGGYARYQELRAATDCQRKTMPTSTKNWLKKKSGFVKVLKLCQKFASKVVCVN